MSETSIESGRTSRRQAQASVQRACVLKTCGWSCYLLWWGLTPTNDTQENHRNDVGENDREYRKGTGPPHIPGLERFQIDIKCQRCRIPSRAASRGNKDFAEDVQYKQNFEQHSNLNVRL